MVPKLRFSRGLIAKVPCAITCTARVPAPRSRSSKFYRPSHIDWTQEETMAKLRIFFFFYLRGSFKCMIVILPTFWRSAPAFRDSWLAMFHSRRCSYIRTDDPSTKTGVHCELDHRGLRSQQFCGQFFPPGAPATSFLYQPISNRYFRRPCFQQDEISSLLDRRRHESSQTYSSYQLVSYLGTSTTLFPAIWTKTARSIEELFSQRTKPKRASSDQRTDEEDTRETCNNNHVGGRALTNA